MSDERFGTNEEFDTQAQNTKRSGVAPSGVREGVSTMGERSEREVKGVFSAAKASATRTHRDDTDKAQPGINDYPLEGGANGVVSRNAPRQLNPFGKAVALVLSVLLVVTTWNTYAIEEVRDMIVGDATPMASGTETIDDEGGDKLLDDVDNGDTDQASNDADAKDDAEGDNADEGDKSDDNAAADDAISEEDMQAYLPNDLVKAEEVIPSLSDKAKSEKKDGIETPASVSENDLKAHLSERFGFSLSAANALQMSDGVFHVDDTTVDFAADFGNLPLLLDGGYLGGSEDTDYVTMTFEAPYVYVNAKGEYVQTLSQEEWKAAKGDKDGMRVALSAKEIPTGWSVWTEHMGQYLKHSKKDLAAGLSGTIVLRYEGAQDENGITEKKTRGQLAAGAAMPQLTATIEGKVPATETLEVKAGYQINSYTAGRDEDGNRKADSIRYELVENNAATLKLVNAEPQMKLAAKVKAQGTPLMGEQQGFAAFLITLTSAQGTVNEKGYTLRVADLPDTPQGAGMLNADGVVALDVTNMAGKEIAAIDPADTAALTAAGHKLASVKKVAEGVADLTFEVEDKAKLTNDAVSGKSEGERVLYVAVPYSAEALTTAEDGAFNAETIALRLTAAINGKAVQENKVKKAKSVNDTLDEEDATYIVELPAQEVAFEKAPEPEPEPTEPEPTDEPKDDEGNEPADEPAEGDNQPAEGDDTEGDSTEEPAEGDEPATEEEPEEPVVEGADLTEPNDEKLGEFERLTDMAGVDTLEGIVEEDANLYGIDPVQLSAAVMGLDLADFGISPFAIAPKGTGVLTDTYFNPKLVASGASTSLGENTYLVNERDNVQLSLQCVGNGSSGYWGGFSYYGSNWFGTYEEDEDGNYVFTRSKDNDDPDYANVQTAEDAVIYAEAKGTGKEYRGLEPSRATLYDTWGTQYKVGELFYPDVESNDKNLQLATKLEDYNEQMDQLGYEKMSTSFTLQVPFLFTNEKGGMDSTYSFKTWKEEGGTYAPNGEPATTECPLFAINFGNNWANVNTNWWVDLIVPGTTETIRLNKVLDYWGKGDEAQKMFEQLIADYPQLQGMNIGDGQHGGLTGEIKFTWHGTQDSTSGTGFSEKAFLSGYNSNVPNVSVKMLGSIPENAGGTINYGGSAGMYTNSSGKAYYPLAGRGNRFTAQMGVGYNNTVRKITLLKTNLTWETKYEAISDNVLYDRYNYMVYKVTTTNTSSGSAEIDYLEYFLTLHNVDQDNNQGITKQDLMQWLLQGNSIVQNPLYATQVANAARNLAREGEEAHSDQYVGVPNKGGVLIYNTTNWLDKDYKDLDKRTFKNLDAIMDRANDRERIYTEEKNPNTNQVTKRTLSYDTSKDAQHAEAVETGTVNPDTGESIVNTPSIPYQTNNQSGLVNFTVLEEDGGHLYPNSNIKGNGDGTYSFLMAVPYTTNINLTVGGQGEGYYVNLDPLTTIFFGKLGVGRDYSWSDAVEKFPAKFGIAQAALESEKNVLDRYTWKNGKAGTTIVERDEPQRVTSTSMSYLGYPVSYEIGKFKTTGNMPLYGENAEKLSAGPEIVDTLPSNFRLYNLEFEVTTEHELGTDVYAPLSQWFDMNKEDFTDELRPGTNTDSSIV